MPFSIVIEDVSKMKVDALVNSTNRRMIPGGHGVDYSIHKAAGPELEQECLSIAPCELAEVKITGGYRIPCKMILHTVGPRWDGTQNCIDILRQCYENVLHTAVEHGCTSIAIPLISSGFKDFPRAVVLHTATEVSKKFLEENDLWIYLNVYHREEFAPTVDFYPVQRISHRENRLPEKSPPLAHASISLNHSYDKSIEVEEFLACAVPMDAMPAKPKLSPITPADDISFGQLVSHYVDQYFDKTSDFYVNANITKAVYSKMKTSPDYKPSRSTALACAVVLKGKGVDERELLSHAGFVLTPADKRDRIIRSAFENHIYDVFEINEVLFDHDLPLLGFGR